MGAVATLCRRAWRSGLAAPGPGAEGKPPLNLPLVQGGDFNFSFPRSAWERSRGRSSVPLRHLLHGRTQAPISPISLRGRTQSVRNRGSHAERGNQGGIRQQYLVQRRDFNPLSISYTPAPWPGAPPPGYRWRSPGPPRNPPGRYPAPAGGRPRTRPPAPAWEPVPPGRPR